MNKNNLPLIVGISIAIGIAIGALLNFDIQTSNRSSEVKIKKLMQFIERDYVDAVNTDELLDNVISGIVDKLDPHSVYFPREQFLANQENMQGNFEGIGVQFFMHKDSLVATQIIKGGPSEKGGLQAGDRILIANTDTLYNKNLFSSDVVKILKGPRGTKVDLTVYRKKTNEIIHTTISRGKVPIESAEVAYMIKDDLGYLKLDRFAMTSYREFKEKLTALQDQGATKLVLDLRQNGGGFVHIATAIADEFLKDGKLIVFTKNNKKTIDESYATSKGDFEEGKIYVLIDENSASASEIVAGALQDNDKGTIIGRRSFGKGLVQQEMELGDGSAVRLTTARYYTPTGRSIQKPYKLNDGLHYAQDYNNRVLSGELLSKDSIKVADSLKFTTPKGKVVYGGGGIIPDVFVAIDTTMYFDSYYSSNLNAFTFDYVDTNRQKLNTIGADSFESFFDANNESIFKEYLTSLKPEKDIIFEEDDLGNQPKIIETNRTPKPLSKAKKELLKFYLKALISRQIYGETAFYKINKAKDNMIQKVLELEED